MITGSITQEENQAFQFEPDIVEQLTMAFDKMTQSLYLLLHKDSSDTSKELEQYIFALARYSSLINIQVVPCKADEKPFVQILYADKQDTGISFRGVPGGQMFTAFVLAIYNVGTDNTTVDASVVNKIKQIKHDTDIKIFVSLTCSLCHDLVISTHRIVKYNPKIKVGIYVIDLYPELKQRYRIEGVPCLVVNNCSIIYGKRNLPMLVDHLIKNDNTATCTLPSTTNDIRGMAIDSLLNFYRSIFYFDLNKNQFAEIGTSNKTTLLNNGAKQYVAKYIKNNVAAEDVEKMLDFFDIDKVKEHLASGNVYETEFRNIVLGWCRAICIPMAYDMYGQVSKMLGCIEDINRQKEAERTMQGELMEAQKDIERLQLDGLTKAYIREVGQPLIEALIQQQTPGVFCIIDCDRFKHINDTYGHLSGDRVLINVAKSISSVLGAQNILFRLGGDEFVFYLKNITEPDIAKMLIQQLFSRIDAILIEGIPANQISISVGAFIYNGSQPADFQELYRKADQLLYNSKNTPGNAVTFSK